MRKIKSYLIILGFFLFILSSCGGPLEVTVSFDTNGGSYIESMILNEESPFALPNDPTKEGHSFLGWYLDDSLETPFSVERLLALEPVGSYTVYASWQVNQYTITFDPDNGSPITSITQDYGTAITAPANPTKENYLFLGWNPSIPSTMPAFNMNLKAIWEYDPIALGTAPVYQGMDVTAVSSVSAFPQRYYNWSFEDSNIIDDIPTIDIPEQPDIVYYSARNEDVFVRVILDNPDSQVILRFTLNGVVYQSFEFEEGSTSELLIVKVNAGDLSGIRELTIDEIKYVENVSNDIKDADFEGDRTITMAVTYDHDIEATISEEVVTSTSYRSVITINDPDNLSVIYENAPVFYLSDGTNIIYTQTLTNGNNIIEYPYLHPTQTYVYAVATTYDLLDGEGAQVRIASTKGIETNAIVSLETIEAFQEALSFNITPNDPNNTGSVTAIELYLNGALVEALSDLSLRQFSNLLSNNTYEIRVTYTYDLNDGNGAQAVMTPLSMTTLAKATPSVEVISVTPEQEAFTFDLNITDIDSVGDVTSIELYRNGALVEALSDLSLRQFSNLLSNNTYEIRVTYTYDLNDGNGAQAVMTPLSMTTLAKAAPTLGVQGTTTQESIAFDYDVTDIDSVGDVTSIELYLNGAFVESLTDLTLRSFTGLLSNNVYEIRVTYTYDLNDGNGAQTLMKPLSMTTLAKATPNVAIINITPSQESMTFELDITDNDQVGDVTSIELYLGETLIESLSDLTLRTFENLLSNNMYEIKVTYTYDLNDGNGAQLFNQSENNTTLAKATPSVEVISVTPEQEALIFDLSITDVDAVGAVSAIELYLNGALVEALSDLSLRTFTGLLSNTKYEIRVTYTYDLNDGNGLKSIENFNVLDLNESLIDGSFSTTPAEIPLEVQDAGYQDITENGFWYRYDGSWSGAAATIAVTNGQLVVDVTTVAGEPWHFMVKQKGISLEHGKFYTLVFDAVAIVERPIRVGFNPGVDAETFAIGTEMATYEMTFFYEGETSEVRLELLFGDAVGTVTIDNVKLFNGNANNNKYKTLAKSTPSIDVVLLTNEQETFSFDFNITDVDSVGVVSKIELYQEDTVVQSIADLSLRHFSDLSSNTEYEIQVTYTYDLNDGAGLKTIIVQRLIKTSPKLIIFYSVQILNSNPIVVGDVVTFELMFLNEDNIEVDSLQSYDSNLTITQISNNKIFLEIEATETGESFIQIIAFLTDSKEFLLDNVFEIEFTAYETLDVLSIESDFYKIFSPDKSNEIHINLSNPEMYQIKSIKFSVGSNSYKIYESDFSSFDNNRKIIIPYENNYDLADYFDKVKNISILISEIEYYVDSQSTIIKDLKRVYDNFYSIMNSEINWINNANDFNQIEDGKVYALANDIDFQNIEWNPLEFEGVFVGNGYSIKNVNIEIIELEERQSNSDNRYYGFFSKFDGMLVDVTFRNITIDYFASLENVNETIIGVVAGFVIGEISNVNLEGINTINSRNTYDLLMGGIYGGGEWNAKAINLNLSGELNINVTDSFNAYIGGIGYRGLNRFSGNHNSADIKISVDEVVNDILIGALVGSSNGNSLNDNIFDGSLMIDAETSNQYTGLQVGGLSGGTGGVWNAINNIIAGEILINSLSNTQVTFYGISSYFLAGNVFLSDVTINGSIRNSNNINESIKIFGGQSGDYKNIIHENASITWNDNVLDNDSFSSESFKIFSKDQLSNHEAYKNIFLRKYVSNVEIYFLKKSFFSQKIFLNDQLYPNLKENHYIFFEETLENRILNLSFEFGEFIYIDKFPSKTGHDFDSYYLETQYNTINPYVFMPDHDIYLYSKFNVKSYNIYFNIYNDNINEALDPFNEVILFEGESISFLNSGMENYAVITNKGRVLVWGTNNHYTLGDGTNNTTYSPIEITQNFHLMNNETVIYIELGVSHSVALTDQNRVFTWGRGSFGKLGNGTSNEERYPKDITQNFDLNLNEQIIDLRLGGSNTFALSSHGRLFAFGKNQNGYIDSTTSDHFYFPKDITDKFNLNNNEKIISFDVGWDNYGVLTDQGRIFTWGANFNGNLGNGTISNQKSPLDITNQFTLDSDDKLIEFSLGFGESKSAAISMDGKLFVWGQINPHSSSSTPVEITSQFSLESDEKIISISLGGDHSSALTSNNRIFMWGNNEYGSLGDGSNTYRDTPVDITSNLSLNEGEEIISIIMGYYHSSLLTSQGNVYGWGDEFENRWNGVYVLNPRIIGFKRYIENQEFSFDFNEAIIEYTPSREGYSFSGWFLDKALTQSYAFGTMPSNDLKLYGKWIPNEE